MRKLLIAVSILASLLLGTSARAQSHSVTLSWTVSTDDTTTSCASPNTCLQNVYRATGACSSSSTFSVVSSPLSTANSFVDSNVSVGQTYCYQVTFVINGFESAPSNQVSAVILPSPPSGLTRGVK